MNLVRIVDHLYLISAISLAVYSQSIIRWRLGLYTEIPADFSEKMKFIIGFLLEPWVVSSIAATFLAGVFWIAALTKFELNYAYPWMGLIFISMAFVGAFVFGESMTANRLFGTFLVVLGLILVARS